MAHSIADAETGRAPAWYAAPTTSRFAGMASPNSVRAAACASNRTVSRIAPSILPTSPATSGAATPVSRKEAVTSAGRGRSGSNAAPTDAVTPQGAPARSPKAATARRSDSATRAR